MVILPPPMPGAFLPPVAMTLFWPQSMVTEPESEPLLAPMPWVPSAPTASTWESVIVIVMFVPPIPGP